MGTTAEAYNLIREMLSTEQLQDVSASDLPSEEQVERMTTIIREHPDLLAVTIVSLQQSVNNLHKTTSELNKFLKSVEAVHNRVKMAVPLLLVVAVAEAAVIFVRGG